MTDTMTDTSTATSTIDTSAIDATDTNVVIKRGPGRPRKTDTATGTTTPVKRRPGRPKGSKNKPKDTATATAAPAVKRGPGRPRKDATATGTAAPTGKRRPGRPKGSKNKPKDVTTATTATAPVVKRGPGRPRKDATATAAPAVKRGPGRPRKDATATGTAAPAVKRGPGRPRKDATATAPVVKRGPGRPRKDASTTGTVKKSKDTRQVLDNPFKIGDSISIPSGAIFTSAAPTAKGRQVVKRGHKVTVHDIIPARVQPRKSETGSNVLVRPPRIRAKGSGGYWKDITLTEKIVRLNGKAPSYETISFQLPADANA